jgi:hypothetical protein
MQLKHVASGVAALAMLALASAPGLGHSGHGHPGGGGWAPHHSVVRSFSNPRHLEFHHFRHHRRFAFVGVYPYDYYVDDGCYWLRRRALSTGSPYWWHRYYACRHGYYD